MLRRRSTDRLAAALVVGALVVTGCKRGKTSGPSPSPSGSSNAVASAISSGAATAGPTKPASTGTPSAGSSKPTGPGVSEFAFATKTPECKHQTAEMANYLLRGELAI